MDGPLIRTRETESTQPRTAEATIRTAAASIKNSATQADAEQAADGAIAHGSPARNQKAQVSELDAAELDAAKLDDAAEPNVQVLPSETAEGSRQGTEAPPSRFYAKTKNAPESRQRADERSKIRKGTEADKTVRTNREPARTVREAPGDGPTTKTPAFKVRTNDTALSNVHFSDNPQQPSAQTRMAHDSKAAQAAQAAAKAAEKVKQQVQSGADRHRHDDNSSPLYSALQKAEKMGAYVRSKLVRFGIVTVAGGGAVVPVIIVIFTIYFLSCILGVFVSLSEQPQADRLTLREVIREINLDYSARIQAAQALPCESVTVSGQRAAWPEVLALYAVQLNFGDSPTEVLSMDEDKRQFLIDLYWELNSISTDYQTETVTDYTQLLDSEGFPVLDENGIPVLVGTERTVINLYITAAHTSPDAVPAAFGLSETQAEVYRVLLSPDYAELWRTAQYGIGTGDGNIVSVALSQVGQVGGAPYWDYVGYDHWVNWCACFVSWCANECGYVENGLFPCTGGVGGYENWFAGQTADRSYEPAAGDLIIFDWEQDGYTDHIGLVEKVENGRVYTVEGNSDNAVVSTSYPLSSSSIALYLIPDYSSVGNTITPTQLSSGDA